MSTSAAGLISRTSGLPPSPTDSASPQASDRDRCVDIAVPRPLHPASPTSEADHETDLSDTKTKPDAQEGAEEPFCDSQLGPILVWLEEAAGLAKTGIPAERAAHTTGDQLDRNPSEQDDVFDLTPANYATLLRLLEQIAPGNSTTRVRRIAAWAGDNLRYSYSARCHRLRLRMSLSDIHQVFLARFKHALRNALDDAIRVNRLPLLEDESIELHMNPRLQLKDGKKQPDAVITCGGHLKPWVVLEVGYTNLSTDSECRTYLEDENSNTQAVIRANIKPSKTPRLRLDMDNSEYTVTLDCWYMVKNADGHTFSASRKGIREIVIHATDTSEGSIDLELRYLDDRWKDTSSVASISYNSIRAWLLEAIKQQRDVDSETTGEKERHHIIRPVKRTRESTPDTPEDVMSSFESTADEEGGDEDYKGARLDVAIRSPMPKRVRRNPAT
ncbi:hypothetical protein Tdes44962_MAKER09027 [Teratosphaeria destructans]|uniref:Uncharacterized protein n=1 Tax=Teratosphaeria destructans TaxID=418781 RepID=A0A9W7W3Y0_9PEZI|nr:hypothetical protein Tdes44962_MAKER09027 [Teratosphaeria destructans]